MTANKYDIKISPDPIEKTSFYQVKEVFQSGNTAEPIRYLYQFNMKSVKENCLERHLDFNTEIFTKCPELVPGQNLQLIVNQKKVENDRKKLFCYPYKYRLNRYSRKKDIMEAQSIQIMSEVVQAIFSVYKESYICTNIRAENFVLAPSKDKKKKMNQDKEDMKDYRWRLQSLPFIQDEKANLKNIDSPYTFKRQYQPPQKEDPDQKAQYIQQSLVWNIGCLWLEILYGQNVLNTHEKVKAFCIGNGEIGVFNIEKALGLAKKLNENYSILTSMLKYDPKTRIPLPQVLQHPLFGNAIHSHICRQYSLKGEMLKQTPSTMQKLPALENLNNFIGNLIKIIDRQNLFVLEQERSAIKKKLKSLDSSLDISNYSPKNIKKSRQINQLLTEETVLNSLSVEQIEKFLKPYKFYYDKTIFLARCCKILSKKLKQKLNYNNLSSIIVGLEGNSNESYDLIFTFEHAIIYMRLIYLRNLLANIQLYQNVFNIPNCNQNINSTDFSSTAVEWQIFSQTAIYDAMKIFLYQKFDQCEKQYQILFELQNNSGIKLSPQCNDKIRTFYEHINYKKCPIIEFEPHFQKILSTVIHEIDENCLLKPGYKMPKMPSPESQLKERESLQFIALLEVCIFIQSPTLFQPEYRKQIFQKYMRIEVQKDPSFTHTRLQDILQSRPKSQQVAEYVPETNIKQIFSFRDYENFLKLGSYKKVNDHVKKLIARYRI